MTKSKEEGSRLEGSSLSLSSSNNKKTRNDCSSGDKKKLTNGKVLREEKRRKYDLKMAQRTNRIELELERKLWTETHKFCTLLTDELLQQVIYRVNGQSESSQSTTKSKLPKSCSNIDLGKASHLLKPYLNLKGNSEYGDEHPSHPKKRPRKETDFFIAEGTETVRTLIRQVERGDGIPLVSILVKPSTFFEHPVNLMEDILFVMESKTNSIQLPTNPRFHVFIVKETVLSKLIGFHAQRGAIACGIPRCLDENWLFDTFLQTKPKHHAIRALILDGICDTSNLGSVIRTAAATGMDFVLLSKDSCNPWSRRCVRVSMGYISAVPIVTCNKPLAEVLRTLNCRFNFIIYAAVLDDSVQALESLSNIKNRWCCVMGNEHSGISKPVVTVCTNRVQIGMKNSRGISVDSFSLPVATGIMLHGLVSRENNSDAIK